MEHFKKNWTFYSFLLTLLIFASIVFVVSKKEKSGVTMLESIKAWGNVTIERYKLPNGLQVILALKSDSPTFAYYTWFNVGSRHEKKGKTGIAHFFEHLLFKESKNLKEGEFDRIMEANGANTNASTWVDWTNYYEVLPSDEEKVELVIRLEAERMQNMILNEKQINSEREVIKNERRFRVDNDVEGTMNERLDHLAYTTHPYGQPVIGWMEDISGLTLEDCIHFYKTYYAPNNATIVIVGNIHKKKTMEWIEKYYGEIPSSHISSETIPQEPPQTQERKLTIRRDDIDVEKVIYAFHVPRYKHEDTPALELLGEILFNGEGSRLYKQMIIEEEIASHVSGGMTDLKDPSLFQISVSMRKNQPIQKTHNRVFAAIEKIQKEGVTQKEFDRARNRFEMEYYHSLESVSGKARALGHYQIIVGDYKEPIHMMKRYQKVKLSDIQRVAQKYLVASNRSSVVALPAGKKAHKKKRNR